MLRLWINSLKRVKIRFRRAGKKGRKVETVSSKLLRRTFSRLLSILGESY